MEIEVKSEMIDAITARLRSADDLIHGGVGHNSKMTPSALVALKNAIDSIERLEAEKAEVAEQIKDCYTNAKALGFDTKVMRKVISLRKQDKDKREEFDTLVELYLHHVEGQ